MQKFGVREICDVVLKAKQATKIGNKVFYKNEPVMYFDTLKTSSLEGAATTVYAQGGRGNSRLIAWEGERTLTFTMEDALISPEGLMILTGAGLVEASDSKPIYQHIVESTDLFTVGTDAVTIYTDKEPYLPADRNDNFAYVMIEFANGTMSEPFIPKHEKAVQVIDEESPYFRKWMSVIADGVAIPTTEDDPNESYSASLALFGKAERLVIDYYTPKGSADAAMQINITPDKFGGNYYLEASTLFKDTNGTDLPAEFIIPNCKVQSNFNFSMAPSGDPSTFTFTLDAFPDYTRFNRSEKVLASLQIIGAESMREINRNSTQHDADHDKYFDGK